MYKQSRRCVSCSSARNSNRLHVCSHAPPNFGYSTCLPKPWPTRRVRDATALTQIARVQASHLILSEFSALNTNTCHHQPTMSAEPNTFAALVANFAHFLTAAIHTIIWERGIYPDTSFIKAKKYNTPVRQSRHPKVCEFIQAAVDAVRDQLLKGTLQQVCLVIYSPLLQALERFVFDVSKFPVVPREHLYTQLEREDMTLIASPSVDLEEQFRAALTRLTGCGTKLSPLPPDCTFNVAVEVKDEADPPIGHPQPWIPTQPSLQRRAGAFDEDSYEDRLGSDLGGVNLIPIRAIDAGEMVFEMWVEEGVGKTEAMSNLSQGSTQLSD